MFYSCDVLWSPTNIEIIIALVPAMYCRHDLNQCISYRTYPSSGDGKAHVHCRLVPLGLLEEFFTHTHTPSITLKFVSDFARR